MTTSKRGLGKGLGALIPQGSVFMGGRTIVNVDINKVVPNPRQPRTVFSKESLHELASSIKEQGIIEPILTRMRDGKYELVAGERRLRAAKLAGLAIIPSIVKDFSDEQSLELSLIENLQREDLNPMDEAEGYARLIAEFQLTQEEVAKKVGKERPTVTNMLRILSLPEKIKLSLRKEEISVGHARALAQHLADGAAGRPKRADVGALGRVDGRGHGHDVDVPAPQAIELRGEFQVLRRLEFLGVGFQREVVAGLKVGNALGIDIETHGVQVPAEFDRQWETHVTQADDGDPGIVYLLETVHIIAAPGAIFLLWNYL